MRRLCQGHRLTRRAAAPSAPLRPPSDHLCLGGAVPCGSCACIRGFVPGGARDCCVISPAVRRNSARRVPRAVAHTVTLGDSWASVCDCGVALAPDLWLLAPAVRDIVIGMRTLMNGTRGYFAVRKYLHTFI